MGMGNARLSHMVTEDGMASAKLSQAMDGMASARLGHITMGNARLSHMVTEDGMASAKLSPILAGALTRGHRGHGTTERRLFCIAIEGDDVDIPKKMCKMTVSI